MANPGRIVNIKRLAPEKGYSISNLARGLTTARAIHHNPEDSLHENEMPKQRANGTGEVLLLVGTMKGAFVLRSDESRKKWKIDGPHFRGFAIYAMLHDKRNGRNRIFAGANNTFIGSAL